MNWYVNSVGDTRSLFETSIPDGIDLREEIHAMLYGDLTKNPKGHWIVVRNFDREDKSKYYNKYTKEGVNGPAHPFTDVLLRSRRVPNPRSNTEKMQKVGNTISDEFIYYLEYDVIINRGDQIYELDIVDHVNKPSSYNFVEKYDIMRVHPYRENYGNIEYYAVIGKYNNITY